MWAFFTSVYYGNVAYSLLF